MSRSRNIKPGFYKNPELVECSVWARLIFPGLWMMADREGRLKDRPKQIKMELLPADQQEVEPLLCELEEHGFLRRYRINGDAYIEVVNFLTHQSPHFSEKPSLIPAPESEKEAALKNLDSGKEVVLKKPDSGKEVALKTPDSVKDLGLKDGGNARTPENSGKDQSLRGGRNPLIPDSLIPDSLKEKEKSRKRSAPMKIPEDVAEQVWNDWLALRKAKKAPVTETVLECARKEAGKAGMTLEAFLKIWCAKGYQGLEASWLKSTDRQAADEWAAMR